MGAHIVKLEVAARWCNWSPSWQYTSGSATKAIHKLGSSRVHGREAQVAKTMLADALAMQDAVADLLLLERVPSSAVRV